jgi:hypothetical protein
MFLTLVFHHFIFYIALISCQDWCSVIAPNGQYMGTSLYKRFSEDKGEGEYWMDNKQGLEWIVNINDKDMTIEGMDFGSKRKMSKETVKRFGLYFIDKVGSDPLKYEIAINCDLIGNNSKRQLFCVFKNREYYPSDSKKNIIYFDADVTKTLIGDRVFIKPDPSLISNGNYMLAINKRNRSDILILDFDYKTDDVTINQCTSDISRCSSPKFIEQMEDSLLKQFDSAIEFERKGHILWFNINGQPFYCFQPKEQPLSDQVFVILC